MKLFNAVSVRKPKLNSFDLSHERKMSLNMGDLVPMLIQEVVPGDKFRVNTEILLRLAPMLAPMMHRVNVYTHYFFVPNRLVYSAWETFITGGADGKQVATFPTLSITDARKALVKKGTLADYMGLPVTPTNVVTELTGINSLPFRAYQLIYNEYYRDQNLTPKIDFGIGETVAEGDYSKLLTMRKRCWEKDYFTSALPWVQRGDDVEIPASADVSYKFPSIVEDENGDPIAAEGGGVLAVDALGALKANSGETGEESGTIDNIDEISAGILVNDLRRAVKLQEWLEKNARAGSRYIEQILSHFGVVSSDARLQRPEYLGGGKNPVTVSEVLATMDSESTPGGTMYGHGISVGKTNSFKKYFEEHGYVIGIMSVLPRTNYQQGVDKMYLKSDKFSFYWPEFANLGEQVVLDHELFFDYTEDQLGTFGYQSRYAEYKFKQSSVHGDFKDSLSFWHMGRIFEGKPGLNTTFVESDPTHRVFAVTDPSVHKLYAYLYNDVKALRPMPYLGIPSL